MRIALRVDEAITWLLSDHLSSTSVTVDATGNAISMLKYTAYGELRTGTSTSDYQYTGQRNEAEIGLYFYVARFYDPQLARFISADTIVPEPNSIKGYDRYAYVNGRGLCTPERSERGNPINYSDPSGHRFCDTADGDCSGGGGYGNVQNYTKPQVLYSILDITIIKSFSLQAIGIDRPDESYTGFTGSGDPNTVVKPQWDDQNQNATQANPTDGIEAAYTLTENIGNASYVLFPKGNQIVTSNIQDYQTSELAYLPFPKLTEVLMTNNSESLMNYELYLYGSNVEQNYKISVKPGGTASFGIPTTSIPTTGLNIFVRAYSDRSSPKITSRNRVLFWGWIDFSIP